MNQNKKETNSVVEINKGLLSGMLSRVKELSEIENTPLTSEEKSFALEILQDINKKVSEKRIMWSEIDIVGCALYSQVKSFARIGLSSINKELYVDIRNNKYTGKKDINILKQYQGLEKELIKWSSKKIVRFYKDVVCQGDEFEIGVDFNTGINKITKHKKTTSIDRNNLANIIGAYAIAYVKENDEIVPYIANIDKNRITRAYNASPTETKTIWKQDTTKMVIKTAVWELYNMFKPFVNLPIELKADWVNTNEKMDWVNTEATQEELTKELEVDANSGEILDFEDEKQDEKIVDKKEVEETSQKNRGF